MGLLKKLKKASWLSAGYLGTSLSYAVSLQVHSKASTYISGTSLMTSAMTLSFIVGALLCCRKATRLDASALSIITITYLPAWYVLLTISSFFQYLYSRDKEVLDTMYASLSLSHYDTSRVLILGAAVMLGALLSIAIKERARKCRI